MSQVTWTDTNQGTKLWWRIASSLDGTTLLAVVRNGNIWVSKNGGLTWSSKESTRYWSACTCSADGSIMYVAVDGGLIYKSTNYGDTWIELPQQPGGAGITGNWGSLICSSNGQTIIAAEQSGLPYRSINEGLSWTKATNSAPFNIGKIVGTSDLSTLYVLANGSPTYIYKYTFNATNTTEMVDQYPKSYSDIACSSDGTKVFAIVSNQGVYINTNSGTGSWTVKPAYQGTNETYYYLTCSSNGQILTMATSGGSWTSTNSGLDWTYNTSNIPIGSRLTSSSDGTKLLAAKYNGSLYTGILPLYTAPTVAPTIGTATYIAGQTQASIAFTPLTLAQAGNSAITSYTVTGTSSNGGTTRTGSGTSSPITVTGLTAGTSYTFRVTATNAYGTSSSSAVSNSISVFTVPSAPTTPTIVSGDTNITVSWVAPANGGSAITGYKLRYSLNGGSSWETAASVGNVLTYNVTGLTDNTNYQFQVLAINGAGDGPYSTATANVQTVTTPSAPQNVSLSTPQKNVIKVDWTAPSNNGGSTITGYTIRYRVQGSSSALTEIDNIDPQNSLITKTYTITGLTGGSLYDVYVYAFNAVDAAKQGAAAYASATPYDVPGAPQSVSAIGGDGYVEINFNDADDNGAPIFDYIISVEGMPDVTGTMSPISFSGLTNGQQYTFSIKANNIAGDGPSATITAIPINPTATTIDTSALVVANVAQAAQVVESMSAASTAVIEQVAAATISQVKGNSTVGSVLTAAKNINSAVASAPVRQAVAKAAGAAAVSTSVSTASTISARLTDYRDRITEVKTITIADTALQPLIQNTVQGAAKAILTSNEAVDIKVASVLITGNSEQGANRVAVKNAAVAAIEEEKSATAIPISGDVLSALKETFVSVTPALATVTTINVLVANNTSKVVNLPIRGESWYTPMKSGIPYIFGNSLGAETATFIFDASTNTMTKDGVPFTAGDSFTLNGVVYDSYALGSLSGNGGIIQPIPIEINLNVEINANGTLEVLGYQPTAPSNIVIADTKLPVDALYDTTIGLIEFWEPDDLNDIMAQLASTQILDGVEGYRITAKKLALGLQNCLVGILDAKAAEPFNLTMYGADDAQNGNRVMTGFGRLALMAYAHYIMGHVQATAAITNDTDFMKGMLSLNSNTLTDYKYANIGNYDGSVAPWTTTGDASDANLAVRLVKALIDNNPTTSLVSNGAATTVANIVKQVIGQDASRATDEDNNKYSPENHGLLRFYPDDVIYVSINLTTPTVTVGTGQQVSGPTMEGLYSNATGDKKYTIKLTLGPKV